MVPAPTPQLWEVPTMSESMALVGLDVHKSQTVAAVLDPVTGELRVERLRGEPSEWCQRSWRSSIVRSRCMKLPAMVDLRDAAGSCAGTPDSMVIRSILIRCPVLALSAEVRMRRLRLSARTRLAEPRALTGSQPSATAAGGDAIARTLAYAMAEIARRRPQGQRRWGRYVADRHRLERGAGRGHRRRHHTRRFGGASQRR